MTKDFIYKQLAKDFGCPCDFSPHDEIMLDSGLCMDDCGQIQDWECWKRYFEVMGKDQEDEGWINCSDRLPSERGEYLAVVKLLDDMKCVRILYFGKPLMADVDGPCFYASDSEWGDVVWGDDVVAWMPVPEI